tara:strand:+ start:410 stop:727 length:318 start_codon:yes stop_codon:yes gene_type:complete
MTKLTRYRTTEIMGNLLQVSPGVQTLLDKATPDEAVALASALRTAYEAGQEDSDARTGKLMARIFGGFIGVTPGVDLDQDVDSTPRERVRSIVRTLAGAAMKRGR